MEDDHPNPGTSSIPYLPTVVARFGSALDIASLYLLARHVQILSLHSPSQIHLPSKTMPYIACPCFSDPQATTPGLEEIISPPTSSPVNLNLNHPHPSSTTAGQHHHHHQNHPPPPPTPQNAPPPPRPPPPPPPRHPLRPPHPLRRHHRPRLPRPPDLHPPLHLLHRLAALPGNLPGARPRAPARLHALRRLAHDGRLRRARRVVRGGPAARGRVRAGVRRAGDLSPAGGDVSGGSGGGGGRRRGWVSRGDGVLFYDGLDGGEEDDGHVLPVEVWE